MQPLQRSYSITEESIENMLQKGALNSIYDEAKVYTLEEKGVSITAKEEAKLNKFYKNKPVYDSILNALKNSVCEEKYLSLNSFIPVLSGVLSDINIDNKIIGKLAEGMSVMDKEAEIQRETKGKNKGKIIYDKESKDIELVRWDTDIEDYMKKEVLPHVPDAKWFWEEDMTKTKPVIKTGAEIPFTRYFYKYTPQKPSNELATKFIELENSVSERIITFRF